MSKPKKKIVVQSLVGRTQLPFYQKCLQSLLTYSLELIELLLHSDGSINQSEKLLFLSRLGESNVSFVESSSSREKTMDQLAGRPNCQNFRTNSIWGIEFFDPLFSLLEDHISFYIDADILFIRPFEGLFERSQVSNGAIFLRDKQWDAYSLRPWQMLGLSQRPKIVKGITTALVCWDKTAIEWDYLEWFLGQVNLHKIPEWVMPTAQAGLASRCEAKTVHHSQILNLYPNAKIQSYTFGLHFLGSYRKNWLRKLDDLNYSKDYDTIDAKFQKCENQSPFLYGMKQTKRWVNTRLNWW